VLTLPTNEELSEALNIRLNAASDVLTVEQMSKPRLYRAELNAHYLMRRAGEHTPRFLARRVGVSPRTIRRYHKLTGVIVEPQIRREKLTPVLFKRLPDLGAAYDGLYRVNQAGGVVTPGYWLEDEHGKRYPALRVVAAQTRGELYLCVRGLNRYIHPSQPERATTVAAHEPAPVQHALFEPEQAATVAAHGPEQAPSSTTPAQLPPPPPPPARPAPSRPAPRPEPLELPRHNPRRYKRPLPVAYDESMAARLHNDYPELSLNAARRAVELCGAQKIRAALYTMSKRNNVREPLRLLLTIVEYGRRVRLQKEQAQRRAAQRAQRGGR
jgi:hypothetical protein